MDYSKYKNKDNTYTSPINGKIYHNLKAIISHLSCQNNGPKSTDKPRILKKVECSFCKIKRLPVHLLAHEKKCYLNPVNNIVSCVVCGFPVKNKNRVTCSYSCSNKHFRTGENHGNWKENQYRTTCFLYHEKKCVVCSEKNIVEVHHLDENHENNNPNNLIPLCSTHHQYWHSHFKPLIEQIVLDYIANWEYN